MQIKSRRLLLFAFWQGTLIFLQILLQKSLYHSFSGVNEPIVHLIDCQFWLSCHFLLLDLGGVWVMEILEQPFLHNAGRLKRYFAVLTPPPVFFFDFLLLFYFFFGFAQSTNQIACIPLNQSFQIRHLFHNLSELMQNILLTLKSKEVIFT